MKMPALPQMPQVSRSGVTGAIGLLIALGFAALGFREMIFGTSSTQSQTSSTPTAGATQQFSSGYSIPPSLQINEESGPTYLRANGTIIEEVKGCFDRATRPGDTVFGLGLAYGDSGIATANGLIDPRVLQSGKILKICPSGGIETVLVYKIAAGDTLYSIAGEYDISVKTLERANGLYPKGRHADGSFIRAGEELYIPLKK